MGKTKASTTVIRHAWHSSPMELPIVCPECGNVKTEHIMPTFEEHLFFTTIKYETNIHCECGCCFKTTIKDHERNSLRKIVGSAMLIASALLIIAAIIFTIASGWFAFVAKFALISLLVGIVLLIAARITLSED